VWSLDLGGSNRSNLTGTYMGDTCSDLGKWDTRIVYGLMELLPGQFCPRHNIVSQHHVLDLLNSRKKAQKTQNFLRDKALSGFRKAFIACLIAATP
jgi:hypothetical protein